MVVIKASDMGVPEKRDYQRYIVHYRGQVYSIPELARAFGMPYKLLYNRLIISGWMDTPDGVEDALRTPSGAPRGSWRD